MNYIDYLMFTLAGICALVVFIMLAVLFNAAFQTWRSDRQRTKQTKPTLYGPGLIKEEDNP